METTEVDCLFSIFKKDGRLLEKSVNFMVSGLTRIVSQIANLLQRESYRVLLVETENLRTFEKV